MKPRIKAAMYNPNLYMCILPGTARGLGYSPKEAYDDWKWWEGRRRSAEALDAIARLDQEMGGL